MKRMMGLMLAAVLVVGCQTSNVSPETRETTKVSPETQGDRLVRVSRTAAFTGSLIYLSDNPKEKDRFALIAGALEAVSEKPDLTIEDVRRALLMLPIKELKSREGRIAIAAATMLWEDYAGGSGPIPVPAQVETLRRFAREIAAGIRAGADAI